MKVLHTLVGIFAYPKFNLGTFLPFLNHWMAICYLPPNQSEVLMRLTKKAVQVLQHSTPPLLGKFTAGKVFPFSDLLARSVRAVAVRLLTPKLTTENPALVWPPGLRPASTRALPTLQHIMNTCCHKLQHIMNTGCHKLQHIMNIGCHKLQHPATHYEHMLS